ncbi:MAG: methyltransferase domain-containing protein, partial [Vulcanimicrobiaceae bacterium]
PAGSLLVDVGCGSMWKSYLYVYLPSKKIRVIGLERFSEATIYGRNELGAWVAENPNFEIRECDLEAGSLPFNDCSVDGVFCSHVIEHVSNRRVILSEIFRILKPAGHLYIETPGERSLWIAPNSKLRTGPDPDPYPYSYYDDESHLERPLTLSEMRSMLVGAGFHVQKSGLHREFGVLGVPLYAVLFAVSFTPLMPIKMKARLRGFAWWNLIGWAIFAVARKPGAKSVANQAEQGP